MSSFKPRYDPVFSRATFLVPKGVELECDCVGPFRLQASTGDEDKPQALHWVCPKRHKIKSRYGERKGEWLHVSPWVVRH